MTPAETFERWAQAGLDHRSELDPDVAVVLHDMALIARVDRAQTAEMTGTKSARYAVLAARCRAAGHPWRMPAWRQP